MQITLELWLTIKPYEEVDSTKEEVGIDPEVGQWGRSTCYQLILGW